MLSLLKFFNRYIYFLTFVGLEILAFFLILQTHLYQQTLFINSAYNWTASIYEVKSHVRHYFNLNQENENLQIENAKLRSQLRASHYASTNEKYVNNDTLLHQKFTYIPAHIVSNSIQYPNNYITLDKGKKSGIAPQMGVFTNNGVLGTVEYCTENYSLVSSLLNKKTRLNARLKSNQYFGTLQWDAKASDMVQLVDIPKYVKITIKDTVETDGKSALFPEGIPIGTVKDYNIIPGEDNYRLNVKLFINFNTVRNAYIIKNLHKKELDSLEQALKNDQ